MSFSLSLTISDVCTVHTALHVKHTRVMKEQEKFTFVQLYNISPPMFCNLFCVCKNHCMISMYVVLSLPHSFSLPYLLSPIIQPIRLPTGVVLLAHKLKRRKNCFFFVKFCVRACMCFCHPSRDVFSPFFVHRKLIFGDF